MDKSERTWHDNGAGAAALAAAATAFQCLGGTTGARPSPKERARQDRRAGQGVALAVKGMRDGGLVAGTHNLLYAARFQIPFFILPVSTLFSFSESSDVRVGG